MKAENLLRMQQAGLPVPPFITVTKGEPICLDFSQAEAFAVRSSFAGEDGQERSFAGQFTSLLEVGRAAVAEAVKQVFAGAEAASVRLYKERTDTISRSETDGTSSAVAHPASRVIIQEMVEAEFAGVLFTANPKGLLSEMVLTAAPGLGDAVVTDAVDTVSLHVHRQEKTSYAVYSGPVIRLPQTLIDQMIDLGQRVESLFGQPMDIEYAYRDGQVLLLQARPISSLQAIQRPGFRPIILDDSNIAESYPGLSSPLTQSFAVEIYSGVFHTLLTRLIGRRAAERYRSAVTEQMVEANSGHLYYRIDHWYEVLRLLPFSGCIIPLWQKMLGVEEKAVGGSTFAVPLRRKLRVALMFIRLLCTVQGRMKRLNADFGDLLPQYQKRIVSASEPLQLWQLYREIFDRLIRDWDWTLINDMYAFLFTGLSGKQRAGLDKRQQLDSMKPILGMERLIEIATQNGLDSAAYRKAEAAYIDRYGDRCVGELKLETETYRTHPQQLREQVAARLQENGTARRAQIKQDKQAEETKQVTPQRRRVPLFARLAANGISGREQSRLNRSRIFGLMRGIIRKLANHPTIALGDDIFYLSLDEIEALVKHPAEIDRQELNRRIAVAKWRLANFAKAPLWNRLVFAGRPYDIADEIADPAVADESARDAKEVQMFLHGTAVSAGNIRAQVVLVRDPQQLDPSTVAGKILVTHSTDPGWFMLVSQCAGIIAERGSLLSHTAIIARELKKPAIVGVRQVFKKLQDGEMVELDAERGIVTRIGE